MSNAALFSGLAAGLGLRLLRTGEAGPDSKPKSDVGVSGVKWNCCDVPGELLPASAISPSRATSVSDFGCFLGRPRFLELGPGSGATSWISSLGSLFARFLGGA